MNKNNNFIFIKLILLYLIILVNGCCNFKKDEELTFPINSTKSTQLACYYKDIINTNNDVTELRLPSEYDGKTRLFNPQEVKIPVKGENFLSQYVGDNVSYYELGHFEYKNNTYRLIIYNKIGESDTLLLNVQINSYDENGKLVDALLLSSFFGYEDIIRFSDFIIHSDYTINIDNYVIYRYKESEDGLSTIIFKEPMPQVYLKENYQIENGRFKLISRREVSQGEKMKRTLNIPCLRH
ncbi:hypothetical protein ACK1QP_004578 [Salmonella enterica]